MPARGVVESGVDTGEESSTEDEKMPIETSEGFETLIVGADFEPLEAFLIFLECCPNDEYDLKTREEVAMGTEHDVALFETMNSNIESNAAGAAVTTSKDSAPLACRQSTLTVGGAGMQDNRAGLLNRPKPPKHLTVHVAGFGALMPEGSDSQLSGSLE